MINPPPQIEKFNYIWKNWLNNLYEHVVGDVKTWTVTLTDALGVESPTTVTGHYAKTGPICIVNFGPLNDIDTTGMVAGDSLRIPLPITPNTTSGIATSSITLHGFNYGSGRTQANLHIPSGVDYALIKFTGNGVSDANCIVSDITDDSSDIVRGSLTYFV